MNARHLIVALCGVALLGLVVVSQSGPGSIVLDVVTETVEGAQFPPDQQRIGPAVPASTEHKKDQQWWWAHRRMTGLAAVDAHENKGKECLELAQRATSAGLKAGDKVLAKVCLQLAKDAETKAGRKLVAKEVKPKKTRKVVATQSKAQIHAHDEKTELPLTIHNKKITLHLYRPHGFHQKLAHPKMGALAAAQAREFGAVEPAFAQEKPFWKRSKAVVGESLLTGDNTPLSIKQHVAHNNMPWWKKDAHFGYKAKEHKNAKVIQAFKIEKSK